MAYALPEHENEKSTNFIDSRAGIRAKTLKCFIFVLASFVGLSIIVFLQSTSPDALFGVITNARQDQLHELESMSAADFIAKWTGNDIGDPFDAVPLRKLCNKEWRTDVVLQLHRAGGGIGNVKSQILDFLFLAVNLGASIVLPQYIKRDDKDLLNYLDQTRGMHDFDYYFDLDYFLQRMSIACPQMRIYPTLEDVKHDHILKDAYVPPRARLDKNPGEHLHVRIKDMHNWIDSREDYDKKNVSILPVTSTLWFYDLAPRERARRAFGKLLKVRKDVRRIAATVISNMRTHSNVTARINPSDTIHRNAYYGAHMRTEDDVDKIGWLSKFGGFDRQSDLHIDMAKKSGLGLVYAASGKWSDIHKLAQKAYDNATIAVLSKYDLLSGPDLAELKSLGWDQQALVDYEVLSRSSFFAGPVMSSFTWGVAMRRYHYNLNDDRRLDNPDSIQETEEHVSYDDGLSRIWLRNPEASLMDLEFLAPRGMFP